MYVFNIICAFSWNKEVNDCKNSRSGKLQIDPPPPPLRNYYSWDHRDVHLHTRPAQCSFCFSYLCYLLPCVLHVQYVSSSLIKSRYDSGRTEIPHYVRHENKICLTNDYQRKTMICCLAVAALLTRIFASASQQWACCSSLVILKRGSPPLETNNTQLGLSDHYPLPPPPSVQFSFLKKHSFLLTSSGTTQ